MKLILTMLGVALLVIAAVYFLAAGVWVGRR
jgi:hypothetical protein